MLLDRGAKLISTVFGFQVIATREREIRRSVQFIPVGLHSWAAGEHLADCHILFVKRYRSYKNVIPCGVHF